MGLILKKLEDLTLEEIDNDVRNDIDYLEWFSEKIFLELLSKSVIELNCGDDNKISFYVNMNDVFAWGCSESKDIDNAMDLLDLYIECKKFGERDGPIRWGCIKEGMQPQKPIRESLQSKAWDEKMESLEPNSYDEHVRKEYPNY